MRDLIQRLDEACKIRKYWGLGGAGIMFVCREDGTVFLGKRAKWVDQPGTWGIFGGGISEGWYKTPFPKGVELADNDPIFWQTAKKEAKEEAGSLPAGGRIVGTTMYKDCGFKYKTFIVNIPLESKRKWRAKGDSETVAFRWYDLARTRKSGIGKSRRLHFGAKFTLDRWNG